MKIFEKYGIGHTASLYISGFVSMYSLNEFMRQDILGGFLSIVVALSMFFISIIVKS